MAGARVLASSQAPRSVLAMLLQMMLEKLAKAALLASHSISLQVARSSHSAAVSLVQQLAGNKRACGRLGWPQGMIRLTVLPLVRELESAQPQQGASLDREAPVLEYPWLSPTSEIR